MASVLLVGFAPDIEASLCRAWHSQGHTIQTARLASAALRIASAAMPALILIHVELPLEPPTSPLRDGFALCRAFRLLPEGEKSMIVFITHHRDTVADKLSGFRAGGDDYLTMPCQMAELPLRLEALLRRSRFNLALKAATATWHRFGPLALDPTDGDVWIAERHEQLTPVETRLLSYLIASAGRPCSTAELLRHVWRKEAGIGDPALVRVHMRHLRAKLETDPTAPKLLKSSQRLGYFLAQDQINEPIC
jgi:two-component system response regulator RpaA